MPNQPNERKSTDTDLVVRNFFDRYYKSRLEYPASEVDAVIGFFNEKGFGEVASSSIAAVLMRRAQIDEVSTFKLLDTLNGLTELQLSALVTEILNFSRLKSSTLGFKVQSNVNYYEARNIAP